MSIPECAHAGAAINVIGPFTLASEQLAAAAREQELWALSNSLSSSDKVFGCSLCPAFGNSSDIILHLRIVWVAVIVYYCVPFSLMARGSSEVGVFSHQVWKSDVGLVDGYLYLHEDSKPQGTPTVWV